MGHTINALRKAHVACDPSFIDKRTAPTPTRPAVAIVKTSDRAWKVHFMLEGDGITRCGLDAQRMCVQPTGMPRLLLLRACPLCARRVQAAGIRDVAELHQHDAAN
jgi:hypothetical protein